MSNYNLHSFCPEFWNQIEITTTGYYKICCIAINDDTGNFGHCVDKNGNYMHVTTHTLRDAINSEGHKRYRENLSKNIRNNICRMCFYSEEAAVRYPGGTQVASKRQGDLNKTDPKHIEYVAEYMTPDKAANFTNKDFTVTSKIHNLDMRFGNQCNYACVHCNKNNSSLWYEEDYKGVQKPIWGTYEGGGPLDDDPTFYIKNLDKNIHDNDRVTIDNHGRYFRPSDYHPWWETAEWKKQFVEVAPDLRHLYFTGGEPLLVKGMRDHLQYLIDNDFAKNINIRMDTNLSVVNPKLFEMFKKFKNVWFCVSVDDTYERYEFFRYPGKWDNLMKNIDTVQDKFKFKIYNFSSCFTTLTPYAMVRMNKLGMDKNVTNFYRFVEYPLPFDIRIYSKKSKLKIINSLETIKQSLPNSYRKVGIDTLIKFLSSTLEESYPNSINNFIKYMDNLDNSRGTNWKKTFPDIADLVLSDNI